jgi:FMN phosphatase YigB (HAD superfamily)
MTPAARLTAPAPDAVLFDLDGVLTETAALHARCRKETFDLVLADHERLRGAGADLVVDDLAELVP